MLSSKIGLNCTLQCFAEATAWPGTIHGSPATSSDQVKLDGRSEATRDLRGGYCAVPKKQDCEDADTHQGAAGALGLLCLTDGLDGTVARSSTF